MQYLPSCRVRSSTRARAEAPVHSLLTVAGAVVTPAPRADAVSLLMAETAPASGDFYVWGTAFRSRGCSTVQKVPAPSPFLSSPSCKEN